MAWIETVTKNKKQLMKACTFWTPTFLKLHYFILLLSFIVLGISQNRTDTINLIEDQLETIFLNWKAEREKETKIEESISVDGLIS